MVQTGCMDVTIRKYTSHKKRRRTSIGTGRVGLFMSGWMRLKKSPLPLRQWKGVKPDRMFQDYKDLLSAFHAHGVKYLVAPLEKVRPENLADSKPRHLLPGTCGYVGPPRAAAPGIT